MFKSRIAVAVTLPLFAAAVFAGCGGSDGEKKPADPPVAQAPAGTTVNSGATGPTGETATNEQPAQGNVEKPKADPQQVAANLGAISDPDNPAEVKKAAVKISRGSADIFTARDPETFCALVDPEFIKQQFPGGFAECQERMGKLFAPQSRTAELKPGKVKVDGDKARVVMRTKNGKPAGIAWYIKRGDRWYLDLSGAPAPGGASGQ